MKEINILLNLYIKGKKLIHFQLLEIGVKENKYLSL